MKELFLIRGISGAGKSSLAKSIGGNGVNEHGVPENKLEIMKNRFEVKL